MIDGRGDVIITDFGLAGTAEQIRDVRSGTPAYMAPEQRAGTEVTARSDIYSLGIVLREIFTGKSSKDSVTTVAGMPATVSSLVERCLSEDPVLRPTAAQVARALPGGDPLAAALAAGATPSPELVAQGGEHTGLSPRIAIALLAVALSSPLLIVTGARFLPNLPTLPPEELRAVARSLVQKIENVGRPPNEVTGYWFDQAKLQRLLSNDVPPHKRADTLLYPNEFWYRSSTVPLGDRREEPWASMNPTTPPMEHPGDVLVVLDLRGHLNRYQAVPNLLAPGPAGKQPDWGILLAQTSVEPGHLKTVVTEPDRIVWEYRDQAGISYSFVGLSRNGRVESLPRHRRLGRSTPSLRSGMAHPHDSHHCGGRPRVAQPAPRTRRFPWRLGAGRSPLSDYLHRPVPGRKRPAALELQRDSRGYPLLPASDCDHLCSGLLGNGAVRAPPLARHAGDLDPGCCEAVGAILR